MKNNSYTEERKYLRAKKRVEALKGYYWHLSIYVLINLFITVTKITRSMHNGETFKEAFYDFGTVAVWLFWGIGIFFHTLNIFGFSNLLGKDWEEKKINKIMKSK